MVLRGASQLARRIQSPPTTRFHENLFDFPLHFRYIFVPISSKCFVFPAFGLLARDGVSHDLQLARGLATHRVVDDFLDSLQVAMPTDQHHKSKRIRYDLLIVPRDDAGQAKSIRFALWHMYLLVVATIAVIVAGVLALLAYTPVGLWIPIENAELVNRYSKELVVLNQRVTSLMEQLVELQEYNVKLRGALGEQAVLTDSGIAVVGSPRLASVDARRESGRQQRGTGALSVQISRPSLDAVTTMPANQAQQPVVFPVVLPAEGYVTRGFEGGQLHYGIDIAGKTGSLVNAAADGYVVFAGWTSDDGYKVILSHSGGFLTFYKHNQSLLKSAPAFVKRGEPIALLGNSGQTSMGPHVHFEIWKDGVPVDPANYILNLNF